MITKWLVITPLKTYDIYLEDWNEQGKEELALCIEEQFGVRELVEAEK